MKRRTRRCKTHDVKKTSEIVQETFLARHSKECSTDVSADSIEHIGTQEKQQYRDIFESLSASKKPKNDG